MQRKNKFLTFILSFVPGLGHLYLGLNRRGLQFMIAAFGCIILTTMMPLVFPFVLAILWFYSLFDALQRATAINLYAEQHTQSGQIENSIHADGSAGLRLDEGIVPMASLQGNSGMGTVWLGGLLIVIGVLVLIREAFPHVWVILIEAHAGTLILAAVLIGFGVWLIIRQTRGAGGSDSASADDNAPDNADERTVE